MQEFGLQNLGKFLIFVGIIISALGVLIIIANKFGFSRLPGDIEFTGKNTKVYFPIVSCIVISVLLSLIMWLINFFRK